LNYLSVHVKTYLNAFLWFLLWTLLPGQALADNSFRVVSQNMYRLFDDIDSGKKYETVISTQRFHQNVKAAAQKIITTFGLPDIIALQEVENINTLNQIIHQIQLASGVHYRAVLREGNDISGINVGFLIQSNYQVISVNQLFKQTKLTFVNSPLFSRPPLLIEVCKQSNCLSLLNLHLRSMIGIRSKTKGHRVRTKRLEQATKIAKWINQFQSVRLGQPLMVLGDLNALSPSDQYIDVVGTIIGKPDNKNTKLWSQDFIKQDLTDLTQRVSHPKRYSYIHKKKKQILDYMIINQQFKPKLERIWFSEIDYSFSDHAGLIADFSW
jgi:predicted extracellular nuclease